MGGRAGRAWHGLGALAEVARARGHGQQGPEGAGGFLRSRAMSKGLRCTALHRIALHCTALRCSAAHCVALRCIAVQCSALQRIASQCIAMH
eukprot:11153620-Lingulodinium_polyedra.AAC.1